MSKFHRVANPPGQPDRRVFSFSKFFPFPVIQFSFGLVLTGTGISQYRSWNPGHQAPVEEPPRPGGLTWAPGLDPDGTGKDAGELQRGPRVEYPDQGLSAAIRCHVFP